MTSHLLSQREAARAWGVSRATIQRSIARGELSQTSEKRIDPAEMVRVFGEPADPARNRPKEPVEATPDPAIRIAQLEAELAASRRENELQAANLADLRSQVRLITHDGAPRRRWWPFGR